MIHNYFKVALRNLSRNKVYALINTLGLALGTACSLLILLWVIDEKAVDNFHSQGRYLYAVYERYLHEGHVGAGTGSKWPLADELKKAIPEVQSASGLAPNRRETFAGNGKILKMEGSCAGTDFFRMFDYPLLEGTLQTALSQPAGIAISRKMAQIFYGSPQAAIGKTLRYENRKYLTINAVFEDLPALSSVKFDYLLSWEAWLADHPECRSWEINGPRTYLRLRPDADAALVARKIKRFLDGYDKSQTANFRIQLGLQPYGEVYLHSNFTNGEPDGGRISYVRLFIGVAFFILLLACINFMNLATARSVKRAREVGMRKVLGAYRVSLMAQFFGEAILLAFFSVLFAVVFVWLALPAFNSLTGKQLSLPLTQPSYWLALGGLTLLVGLIAGSYPALFLSALQPVRVLKGIFRLESGSLWFGKGLVVFQFVLSILLIIGTLVVTRQTEFLQKQSLGFDRENLLYIPLEGDLPAQYSYFKQQASQLPGIHLVDRAAQTPQRMEFRTYEVEWAGKDPTATPMFTTTSVGYDFVELMGLKLLQGRNFSPQFTTDSTGFLINETAARVLGFQTPVGKSITLWGQKGKIIGVLRDFHYNSLQTAIRPLLISLQSGTGNGYALVRIQPGKTKEALAGLKQLYLGLNPKLPFTFSFLDEEYQKFYRNEQMITQLSTTFACLAIFISCLGLLGLSIFTAQQRQREIGIRKVLGASMLQIMTLLSREFLQLVLLSFVLAVPLAWLSLHQWLTQYAYRIEMSGWVFALAGLLALLIALLTVGFQAFNASRANPAHTMRSE